MNHEIKQIASRLRGFRESVEISTEEMAQICGITESQYVTIESGEKDIPVSILNRVSKHFGIHLSALMFGDEAHMRSYYVTRAKQGPSVERTKAYKYEDLAAGFQKRTACPFIVKVEPNTHDSFTLNQHQGEEFNYILKGSIEIEINKKRLTLNEGDSIYFDSSLPHGMKALNNQPAEFLAIIL